MRNETVVARIAHRCVEEAINHQGAGIFIELVFDGFTTDRDFYNDVYIRWWIVTDGYRIYTYGNVPQFILQCSNSTAARLQLGENMSNPMTILDGSTGLHPIANEKSKGQCSSQPLQTTTPVQPTLALSEFHPF